MRQVPRLPSSAALPHGHLSCRVLHRLKPRLNVKVQQGNSRPFPPDESLETAWNLLKEFTSKEARGLAAPMLSSLENRQALRNALLLVAAHPWAPAGYTSDTGVLLGVVASDVRLGVRSLRDYCDALGLNFVMPTSRVPNAPTLPMIRTPVYIKLNSKTGLSYVSTYDGRDRGVLINFGTEQIGHLPLGLHDEKLEKSFELF